MFRLPDIEQDNSMSSSNEPIGHAKAELAGAACNENLDASTHFPPLAMYTRCRLTPAFSCDRPFQKMSRAQARDHAQAARQLQRDVRQPSRAVDPIAINVYAERPGLPTRYGRVAQAAWRGPRPVFPRR